MGRFAGEAVSGGTRASLAGGVARVAGGVGEVGAAGALG